MAISSEGSLTLRTSKPAEQPKRLTPKMMRYRDLFIYKMKRNLQSDVPLEVDPYANCNRKIHEKSSEFELSIFLTNLMVITNNLSIIILLLLSTFQGLIDEFS